MQKPLTSCGALLDVCVYICVFFNILIVLKSVLTTLIKTRSAVRWRQRVNAGDERLIEEMKSVLIADLIELRRVRNM